MAKQTEHGIELRNILAKNIRAYRHKHNLSQEQLAEKCGLHRTYIGSVERAERNVTLGTLETLATALQVSVSELLTERGSDNDQLSPGPRSIRQVDFREQTEYL